jgi:hypothetical protein
MEGKKRAERTRSKVIAFAALKTKTPGTDYIVMPGLPDD